MQAEGGVSTGWCSSACFFSPRSLRVPTSSGTLHTVTTVLYSADKAEGETGEGNKWDLRLIDLTSSGSGLEFRSGFVE